MKDRRWRIFALFILAAAFQCAVSMHSFYRGDWVLGSVFAVLMLSVIYDAYLVIYPRCSHERQVLVGLCGDERVVGRRVVPHPEDPEQVTEITGTIQSGKVRCMDCGRVWLYRPTSEDIAEFKQKIEEWRP